VGIKLRDIDWTIGSFLVVYHAALLIGLPFYFYYSPPGAGLVVASIVLLFLTEIGVGGAYHRFYAHRCYTLSKPAEFVLLALATLATQGSVLRWSYDHRMHHSYIDTDRDPYNIKRGFWYAHMLWLFHKSKPIDETRIPDLMQNRLAVFHHRHHFALSMAGNALLFGAVGWLFNDYLGAFVLAWWTRLLFSHHLTWFVNSLAHTWGERTYSKEHSAVDNYILALLTVGEGYHNYHHTFATDYRNGFRWYHFDPTKWTIWLLSKLGLAHGLKRFNLYTIRKRLISEDRRVLLESLAQHAHEKKQELEHKVEELAEALRTKLARIHELAEELKRSRGRDAARPIGIVRTEFKILRESLRRDWKEWSRLCGSVLSPVRVPA
jgi:stearoyl-CoA desaturase (delta-9 desaturase)